MEIAAGDHVIVYSSRDQVDSIIITPGTQFQSKYGHYKHDAMLGVAFGSKFPSSNGRGFVYLLRPTPELWTLALPHRTQILYLPDIAFITSYLDVKPGSQIVEAGTGSGSFSHSLARTVGSTGQVHSFEFHEERFNKAKAEFELHGLNDVITLKHQNVYKDGFELVDQVDSVFLDLPAPWEAVGHAKIALRKDRQSRICCFSPCIEQVIRTVTSLTEAGFSDITMYETLIRSHDGAPLLAPPISSAIDRILGVEIKKERRRDLQIEDARKKRELKKRERDAELAAAAVIERESDAKKVKIDGEVEGEAEVELVEVEVETEEASTKENTPAIASTSNHVDKMAPYTDSTPPIPELKRVTFKAGPQLRGHTSYLTFATLLPTIRLAPSLSAPPAPIVEPVIPAPVVPEAAEDDFPISEAEMEALATINLTLTPPVVS